MFRHSTSLLITIFAFIFVSCDNKDSAVSIGRQISEFSINHNIEENQSCLLEEQNQKIVDVFQSHYLFNDEMQIPADYKALNTQDLVQSLRVSEKEEYSFWIEDSASYDASFSQGLSSGLFGFRLIYIWSESGLPEDDRLAMYVVESNSPAYEAGLRRGDTIVSIDDVTSTEIYTQLRSMDDSQRYSYLVALLGLDHSKDELNIVWETKGNPQIFSATIDRDSYATDVVESAKVIDNGESKTGYLAYRSFSEFSSDRLIESFDAFNEQSVDNVIFDFRSNGGGLVNLAMFIANSTLNNYNTLTGQPLLNYEFNTIRSFNNTTFNFADSNYSIGATQAVVIIDAGSCSASELVINMLKPYADVTIIGDQASCGKPYGMERTQICDGYLFPVTLKFTNADNEADYIDGFSPDCFVEDNNEYNWGDVNDPQINEALHILNGGSCRTIAPEVASLQAKSIQKQSKLQKVSTYTDYENPYAPIFKY